MHATEPSAVPTLYIRLHRRVKIRAGETLVLRDVAQTMTEPELAPLMSSLPLCSPQAKDGNMLLIDMMTIVAAVRQAVPNMQIEHFGEAHVLVEVVSGERTAHPLLVAFVWLLLFIGSGLAIMNFHADVSMLAVHRRIYELITGRRVDHPYLLQIPYSLGIGFGMALFFNHLFRKKFNEEPSPLDVEMFMYQENVNRYVITEEYGKMRGRRQQAAAAEEGRAGDGDGRT